MSSIWKRPGEWSKKLRERFPKDSDTDSGKEGGSAGSSNQFIVSTRPAEKSTGKGPKCCFGVVNIPLTEIKDRAFSTAEIDQIKSFAPEAVVLTSTHGAEVFFTEIQPKLGEAVSTFYCIGPATTKAVEARGFTAHTPGDRDSDGLGDLLWQKARRQKLLLFRSSKANKALNDRLKSSGFQFISVTAYDIDPITGADTDKITEENCFGVVFTSALEVDALMSGKSTSAAKKIVEGKKVFSIGKYTTEKLNYYGIEVSEPKGNSDFDELISGICSNYCQ